ncbi:MAG: hypothetical protein M3280_09630 [Actinomycetota bacterium]|nr:hypothetical protein [Actinomycetota bacterium]
MNLRTRRLLPLLLCLVILAAGCAGDGGNNEENGDDAQTGPVFGSADLEQMVLAETDAPEGLVFDEHASGPITVYSFLPDDDRRQVAMDNGFELAVTSEYNAPPPADPAAPPEPVSDLNTTRLISDAAVFSGAEGASAVFSYLQDHGNPEAVERTSEPVEGLGDEAYSALAIFQDPGRPKLFSYSYQWRIGNTVGLLVVQSPKEADRGGPAEADMLALAKDIVAQAPEQPSGEEIPIPPEGTPGEVLFEDDFENEDSGWELKSPSDPPGSESAYVNGQFRLTVDKAGGGRFNDTGGIAKEFADFTDTSIEVDAENAGGQEEAGWGLMCREQGGKTFYAFIVSGAGRAYIVKNTAPDQPFSFLATLSPSEDLASAFEGPHQLRADCVGDDIVRLSLYVNGELVAEAFDDDPFPRGAAGLWSESPPEVGAEILYDNFVVKEAAPAE